MARYVETERFSQENINAEANLVCLRSDIHKLFDDKVFAIIPKRNPNTPESPEQSGLSLVVHIFNPIPDSHFDSNYHNLEVHPFEYSIECLFARFAWTVFSPGVLGKFLLRCVTARNILVMTPETLEYSIEKRNAEQSFAIYKASQSRSASPQKRSAGEMSADDEIGRWDEEAADDVSLGVASRTDSGFADDDEGLTRGRPRKRRRGSSHQVDSHDREGKVV